MAKQNRKHNGEKRLAWQNKTENTKVKDASHGKTIQRKQNGEKCYE